METLKIQIPQGFKIDKFDTNTGEVSFAPVPKSIIERIQSIEDAIKELGNNDPDVIDYNKLISAKVADHIIGNQELIIITKALNEGWIPNWTSGKWDKWFNWFDFNTDDEENSSSSGRFSFCVSDLQLSRSACGSRLCFKSKELAEYAANQFFDIYKKTFTI